MASSDLMLQLASTISSDVDTLDHYFLSKGLQAPSFVSGVPSVAISAKDHPTEAAAYDRVLSAVHELQMLLLGPRASLRALVAHNDVFTLQVIDQFNIPECVPLDGEISFDDVSSKCGLSPANTRRILRYAMTNYIFYEPTPGFVAHTAASRLLLQDPITRAATSMSCNETAAASCKTAEVLKDHPNIEDPVLSGWGLFNNAKTPMFEELGRNHPQRAAIVGRTMDFMASTIPAQPLNDNYPWASLGDALIIDIGGCHGPVSIALARQFPLLRFIVQDLAGPVKVGRDSLPSELAGRITFMEHDFFESQPVTGADVYFFRATMHNWPDRQCIAMLRALTTALKPGARVIINDTCLPEPGVLSPWADREMRKLDLNMMHLFNARDREVSEWERLFVDADKRWKFCGVRTPLVNKTDTPTAALMSIIEAVWTP